MKQNGYEPTETLYLTDKQFTLPSRLVNDSAFTWFKQALLMQEDEIRQVALEKHRSIDEAEAKVKAESVANHAAAGIQDDVHRQFSRLWANPG